MFDLTVTLLGSNGKRSTVSFALDALDFGAAQAAKDAIIIALKAVTTASIAQTRLALVEVDTQTLPVGADVFEAAMLSVHLNDVTEVQKLGTIAIPAPTEGIFMGALGVERDIVDKTAPPVLNYVTAIADYATISDGEKPDPTHGYAGIHDGRRIVRKARLGR